MMTTDLSPHSRTDCCSYVASLEQQLTICQQQQQVYQRIILQEQSRREYAEDALHQSEMLFRTLIEHNRDPLIVINNDTIRHVNPAAELLLERPASELVGLPIGFFQAEGSTEVDVIGKHGKRAIADMQVVDIEWEGKTVSLASLRDVTDYKRMAYELQQANELLEQRVRERTAELAQANEALHEEVQERKRTEQALRASEERFRMVAELVSDFAYALRVDTDGSLVLEWTTDAFMSITGFTMEEVEARGGWERLVYPDDCTLVQRHRNHLLNNEGVDEYEYRITTQWGSLRWLRNHCRSVWNAEQSRITYIYGGVQDITEWKQAMEAMHESEQKFHSFFEQSNDGLILMNDLGYIIEWNHETERLLEKGIWDVMGLTIWDVLFDLFPQEHQTTSRYEHIKKLCTDILTVECETTTICFTQKIRSQEGSCQMLDVRLFLVHTDKGTLAGAIMHDITDQQQTEDTLRASEERFRTVANFTYDWEYWVAPDMTYVYVSPSCERITGYTPDEFYADPELLTRIVHPDDQAIFMDHMEYEAQNVSVQTVEFRIITRSGAERWMGHACVPVYSADGSWIGRRGSNRDITERKQAEQELDHSRALLRDILESIAEGIAVFTREQGIVNYNDRFQQLWGLDNGWKDITTWPERAAVMMNQLCDPWGFVRWVETSDTHCESESYNKIEFLDGRVVECYNMPYRVNGDFAGRVWSLLDVTERVRVEHELRLAQFLLDNAGDPIYRVSSEGRFVYVNEEMCRKLGYTRDELLAMRLSDITPQSYAVPWEENWRTLTHQRAGVFESQHCCKDGTVIPVEVTHTYLVYHDQEYLCGISRDITERKQMAEELEERIRERTSQLFHVIEQLHTEVSERERINSDLQLNRDLLRTMFDGIPDSLVLLDVQGTVLAANLPMARLLGYETSYSLVQKHWSELCQVCGDDEDVVATFPGLWVLDVLHEPEPHRRREVFDCPNGTSSVIDMQTLPIIHNYSNYQNNGEKMPRSVRFEQVLLHIADVTERLQLEQLQLENERLATIRRLTQIIAHEVNTPLQTILNALEGLLLSDERYRTRFLTQAQNEIERIGAILHRLKDPLQSPTELPEEVHIARVLEQVLILTAPTLKKHHVMLEQDIAADVPVIYARPDQLMQVFLNLILNAIEAMPNGGELRLSCCVLEAGLSPEQNQDEHDTQLMWTDGGMICIECSDTGNGIPPDVQEHIFDSFFTTKEFGTGLGLAVSQKIISEHNGIIRVSSQPGTGTTFVILLPFNVSSPNLQNST